VAVVALLAAATTGPTAAVALAGTAALSGANGPATAPLMATGPAITSVLVPETAPADSGQVDEGQAADLHPELQRIGSVVPTLAPTLAGRMRAE
jgi:hypothetical protein